MRLDRLHLSGWQQWCLSLPIQTWHNYKSRRLKIAWFGSEGFPHALIPFNLKFYSIIRTCGFSSCCSSRSVGWVRGEQCKHSAPRLPKRCWVWVRNHGRLSASHHGIRAGSGLFAWAQCWSAQPKACREWDLFKCKQALMGFYLSAETSKQEDWGTLRALLSSSASQVSWYCLQPARWKICIQCLCLTTNSAPKRFLQCKSHTFVFAELSRPNLLFQLKARALTSR